MLERIFIYTYVLSLAIPGRWRLMPELDHYGGAEVAISPFDIPLFSYLIVKLLLIVIFNKNTKIKLTTDIKVIALYLFCNAIFFIFGDSYFWSSLELLRYIKFFIVFLIIKFALLNDEKNHDTLFNAILVVIVIQLITSLIQQVFGVTISGKGGDEVGLNNVDGELYRSAGTLGHPGTLSQFIVTICPFLWMEAMNKSGFRKMVFMAGYFISVVIVVLSFARTGIAMIAVATLLMIFHSLFSKGKFFSKITICAVLLVAAFIFIDTYFGVIYDRFINAPDESGEIRIVLAEIALKMITSHPFFGIGLNTFTTVMTKYDVTNISSWWPHPVHNIYLLIMSETGILGFGLFMFMNFYFVRLIVKGIRLKDPYDSKILYASGVSILSIAFFGMLGWSWRLDSIQGLYWLVLAMISASYTRAKNNKKLSESED